MGDSLEKALAKAVSESKCPGAVAYVGDLEGVKLFAAAGARQLEPERKAASKDTIYDLASLTKTVATTTAIMLLRDDGALDLEQPVSEIVPIPAFGKFTIRHLLTHTSGLVAGKPYYTKASSIDEMLQLYSETGIDWEPGTNYRYSDVGFMILGRIVELAGQDSLDRFCQKRIFEPLGLKRTGFKPSKDLLSDCAATEKCAWRKRIIVGEVHDENAYAMGGVAGHAGLFSNAEDLASFCRGMLKGEILKSETLDETARLGQVPCYPWQGLGWQLDPWTTKKHGFLPARAAFGHSGWTGTSLWVDRDSGLFAILLGNTCHPSRDNRDNETLRRVFHEAVAREFYIGKTNAHGGLDRLVRESFTPVRGRRLAVLTNHSAIDQLSRHMLDVLNLDPEVKPHILYSPEHGLRGKHEAGASVPSTGGDIPVVSLYGERKRPTKDELAEVDLFVVDLQDIGARYYTYMATMKECLAACAETGKRVLVLDRPNPLGGDVLEGPIAKETSSLVCCAPIPVRHGMTMGELALFFQAQYFRSTKLQVTVNLLDGWRRSNLFDECALPWEPPSPNIPSAQTALLYIGTCLFEGTNLNEGRGTETPFHVIGAPWLDADAIVRAIPREDRPGCSLEAVTYTPVSIPGKAGNPRFKDTQCNGVRIHIDNPRAVRAFTLAIAMLGAIRKRHPDDFKWEPSFDVLAGSADLRQYIEKGESPHDIIARWEQELAQFDKKRPRRYV